MSESRREPVFNLSHFLLGVRLDNWVRVLAGSRFRIAPEKIPQAVLISLMSLVLFPFALAEGAVCALPVAKSRPEKDPVFILGHWRSGTTFLQNLMSQDEQFGWPDPVQTAMFSNCILLGWLLRAGVKSGIKNARPMDNVQYDMSLPMEETFCLGNFTPYMLSHLVAFPIDWEKYLSAVFVDKLEPKKREAFKRSYDYVIRKLTMLHRGKQLVLKSPDNTGRIGALLELYPDAKFVNIYRDPYDTILSAVNMIVSQIKLNRLSPLPEGELVPLIEDMVIERMFVPMYKDLFAREGRFGAHQYVSVKYEDFAADPETGLREIYEALELPGFEAALPRFRSYIAGQRGYQKNRHKMRPELRAKINGKLGFYFQYYGYEMLTEEDMQ